MEHMFQVVKPVCFCALFLGLQKIWVYHLKQMVGEDKGYLNVISSKTQV